MKESGRGQRIAGIIMVSTSAHLICFTALGFVPPPSEVLAFGTTDFEVVETEVEPEPEPEPEPEEPEPPPPPPPKRAIPEQPARAPEPEPAAEQPPEPMDFRGVTLTADGAGAGWSTVVGDGRAFERPVGAVPKGEPQEASKKGPPRRGPVKDQSRRPVQPTKMGDLLRKFYPARAKSQGIEGRAVVRAKVMPNGRVRVLRVIRETGSEGFGAACQRMLTQGPRWRPALDKAGNVVPFEFEFTCDFEVGY